MRCLFETFGCVCVSQPTRQRWWSTSTMRTTTRRFSPDRSTSEGSRRTLKPSPPSWKYRYRYAGAPISHNHFYLSFSDGLNPPVKFPDSVSPRMVNGACVVSFECRSHSIQEVRPKTVKYFSVDMCLCLSVNWHISFVSLHFFFFFIQTREYFMSL